MLMAQTPAVAGRSHTNQLVEVAVLLDTAHMAVSRELESQERVGVERESFALGILLAQGHAAALIPEMHLELDPVLVDVDEMPIEESAGVTELLALAEAATRTLPLDATTVAGFSELVVELCDLVREARDLGY